MNNIFSTYNGIVYNNVRNPFRRTAQSNEIKQADLIVTSKTHLIATKYNGIEDARPRVTFKSTEVQPYLDFAQDLHKKIIRDNQTANSIYKTSIIGEYIPSRYYTQFVNYYRELYEQSGIEYKQELSFYNDDSFILNWLSICETTSSADTLFCLGYCYLLGKGVNQNYESAKKYFEEAARKGNKDALDYLL